MSGGCRNVLLKSDLQSGPKTFHCDKSQKMAIVGSNDSIWPWDHMTSVSGHIYLRNPVIWASNGLFCFQFFKHIFALKSVLEWTRTDPKAPLEAKLHERSPRVKILRLRQATAETRPVLSQEHAINKIFLYVEISQKFWREVNACAISNILTDFG